MTVILDAVTRMRARGEVISFINLLRIKEAEELGQQFFDDNKINAYREQIDVLEAEERLLNDDSTPMCEVRALVDKANFVYSLFTHTYNSMFTAKKVIEIRARTP